MKINKSATRAQNFTVFALCFHKGWEQKPEIANGQPFSWKIMNFHTIAFLHITGALAQEHTET